MMHLDLMQWPDREPATRPDAAEDVLAELLGSLRDIEIELIDLLPRLVSAAHDPELRAVLSLRLDDARRHRSRLRWIIGSVDLEVPSEPGRAADAICALATAVDEVLDSDAAGSDRDADLVAFAMRIDGLTGSVYHAARRHAGGLLYSEVESLLDATLADGRRAERRLLDLAQAAPLRLGPGDRTTR